MMYFYNKNKHSIWLFIAIFAFLFFYDVCLIATINDLDAIKTTNDIGFLYSLHPLLPLPRIVKGLFKIQYFDSVGFMEILKTITYVIGSLNIFDIIFLILLLVLTYFYLFKKDKVNRLTMTLFLAHLVVFLVHISISSYRLYDSFVGVNESVVQTMNFLRIFSIIVVSIYFVFLLLSLVMFYVLANNDK